MAIVWLISEGTNTRRDVFEERSLPAQAAPMFLGSKYGGETLRLTFGVQGEGVTRNDKFLDAESYIKTTLKGLIQTNEEITVGPGGDIPCPGVNLTVKVDTMNFDIQPQNSSQVVQMTVRGGYL